MTRLFLLSVFFTLFFFGVRAQDNSNKPNPPAVADNRAPCEKNPELPAFKITLPDTTQVFNTADIKPGKKTAFILFGPECGHCRDFFRKFFVGIDSFTNIDFYLVTPVRSPTALASFYNEFKIASYKNIKATGRDLNFFTMEFFSIRQFPSMVLYDEHKKLIKGYSADAVFTDLKN